MTYARDGRRVLLETVKVPMYTGDGRLLGVLGVSRDITPSGGARREELERHRYHLEELIDNRTRELEIARDEAQAPIGPRAPSSPTCRYEIRIAAQRHHRHGAHDATLRAAERQLERLDKIDRAGQHLLGVINNVLDLSKIEADKLALDEVEFPLASLFANISSMLSDRAPPKGLSLRIASDLPPLRVSGDLTACSKACSTMPPMPSNSPRHGEVTLAAASSRRTDHRC